MSTNRADRTAVGGRTVTGVVAKLRRRIRDGTIVPGAFMPSERQIAEDHGLAKMTARRVLKSMEAEGLVVSEPRQGYRVLGRAVEASRGCPIAFVVTRAEAYADAAGEADRAILAELQRAAARRAASLLVVSCEGRATDELLEQLRSARVCGAVLDAVKPELIAVARRAGVPVLTDDAWVEGAEIDAVTQDSFLGAMRAGLWLAGRGHRRVGWIGPTVSGGHPQAVERYCGAVGGLARSGLRFEPGLEAGAALGDAAAAEEAARQMLSRKDRPSAVLALWQDMTRAVVRAADELGLVIGKDLDMVGWSTEEGYESQFLPFFRRGRVPPAVTWSVANFADVVMARLAERRVNPKLPAIQLRIPTRLRLAGEA